MSNEPLLNHSTLFSSPILSAKRRRVHRAGKACSLCRVRKVRCDAELRYPEPCTNCGLDAAKCLISSDRKRRTPRNPLARAQLDHKTSQSSSTANVTAFNIGTDGFCWSPVLSTAVPPFDTNEFRNGPDFRIGQVANLNTASPPPFNRRNSDRTVSSCRLRVSSPANNSTSFDWDALFSQDCSVGNSQSVDPQTKDLSSRKSLLPDFLDFGLPRNDFPFSSAQSPPLTNPSLPFDLGRLCDLELDGVDLRSQPLLESSITRRQFVAPFPWVQDWCVEQLDDRDWERAAAGGALSSPDATTVENLMRLYFQLLHPALPLLSERHFHDLINPNRQINGAPSQKISLALLNAIMYAASGFMNKIEARKAGFTTIRAMRAAFFTRTKLLYDLGCESDILGRIRICLLLSHQRSYPNAMFENEQWALKAYHWLQEVNVNRILEDKELPSTVLSHWRRVYCCWALRTTALTLATCRTSSQKPLSFNIPPLQISDLQDDIGFPWFYNVQTKHRLAQIFLARLSLTRRTIPLCNFLMELDVGSQTRPDSVQAPGRSILADIEQAEARFSDWKLKYETLLSSNDMPSRPDMDDLALAIQQSQLKLIYEYGVSILHQITLVSYRASASKWADRVREPSQQALWESTSSSVMVLKELLDKDLIHFLPVSAVICVFLPFIINYLNIKRTIRCNTRSVCNIYICTQALEILKERYEVVDYYMDLADASLAICDNKIVQESPHLSSPLFSPRSTDANSKPQEPQDALVPQSEIHTMVICFLNQSFTKGRIADTRPFMESRIVSPGIATMMIDSLDYLI